MEHRLKIGPGAGILLFDEIVSELQNCNEVIVKKFDPTITKEQKEQIMNVLLSEVDAHITSAGKREGYKMVSHVSLDFEENEITVVANPYYLTNYKRCFKEL